jgi:predicted glycosyltransferase
MNLHLNENILKQITDNPLKAYVVMKVVSASALYSVTNKVAPEEAVEEFILEMFSQVNEPIIDAKVPSEEIN